MQCSANLIKEPTDYDVPSTSGSAPGVQDSKKTCNLENYFEWSSRLRLFVANEILQVCNLIRLQPLFDPSSFIHSIYSISVMSETNKTKII